MVVSVLLTMVVLTTVILVLDHRSQVRLAVHPVPECKTAPQLVCAGGRTAEDCVIYFTDCRDLTWSATMCGHGFYTECINRWFQEQVEVLGTVPTCPLCRAPC